MNEEIADIFSRMFRFDLVKELYGQHLITKENYIKFLIDVASIELDLNFSQDNGGKRDVRD